MPYFEQASSFPAFPDGLPTAPLARVSLSKLVEGDAQASNDLFDACRTTGFFAVDLQDHSEGRELVQAVNPIFEIADNTFKLEDAEKDQYSFTKFPGKPLMGYKAHGAGRVDAKGTPDRCELWGIAKDDVFSLSPDPLPKPAVIKDNNAAFQDFMSQSHRIVDIISGHLDRHLGLAEGSLASRQRIMKRSANQVRMIKVPPVPEQDHSTSFVPHTDVGAITVLFNVLGGLQILPPGGRPEVDSDWRFVKPEPGCAIINLGDAMVKWSNGILRSNMHRVTFPPGKQAEFTRFSVAYFARPEAEVLMAPLDSDLIRSFADKSTETEEEVYTAERWEQEKGKALHSGRNKPMSLGGKQFQPSQVSAAA